VSLVVLVILAMVWAVFLLPQLFRARAERSTDLIGAFGRQLSVLERATSVSQGSVTRLRPAAGRRAAGARPAGMRPAGMRPAGSIALARAATPRPTGGHAVARHRSPGRASARKRRRDIFCGLLVAMGVSLVLSIIPAMGMMLWVHLALDVAFVAYVALLVRVRNLATERELKVRFLPTVSSPQPQLLLRRSAN
jgi:hypothetical protein